MHMSRTADETRWKIYNPAPNRCRVTITSIECILRISLPSGQKSELSISNAVIRALLKLYAEFRLVMSKEI